MRLQLHVLCIQKTSRNFAQENTFLDNDDTRVYYIMRNGFIVNIILGNHCIVQYSKQYTRQKRKYSIFTLFCDSLSLPLHKIGNSSAI